MEHRWGKRGNANLRVRVGNAAGVTSVARLRDVSMSGAFLETVLPVREMERVSVRWTLGSMHQDSELVQGEVVRRTRDGIGVEWCEFACPAVMHLLHEVQAIDAGAVRQDVGRKHFILRSGVTRQR